MLSNKNESNGAERAAAQPACAACKHQRKRCKRECILAPYFPADKSKEFQALHKVFGVSNLGKLMTRVKEVDRKKASESFTWEASWRLLDPALGPQGEYLKVCEELKKYKKLCEELSRTVQLHRTMTTPRGSVIGWNVTNGMGNGIMNGNSNSFSRNNNTSNNLMVDLSTYGFQSQYVQNPDKVLKQQKDVGPIVVPYQQQQQQNSLNTGHHQQYCLPAGKDLVFAH
ncbi:LOB domain-containing protein 2-like [Tripterygium wilfordii]|uniref:LOB domain-containing protein 2-like n=1 Tax=Tripterygium wilfordii TaxID=458696 RepID=A0A7J7CF76_TRIWF|nr:LOB domain-containing protein 2-like [Tripterygium wilfordii]